MNKHDKQKEFKRNSARKLRYGIDGATFKKMVKDRNGKCDICNQPPKGKRKTLNVDHDHKTNKIRGLLCNECNLGLGYLGDNEEITENIKKYFDKQLTEEELIQRDLYEWMKNSF